MKYLHISAKVEDRIASLKKDGKAGTALAQKAKRIIKNLASQTSRRHMDAIGSFTKYGEKRFRNCRKYDLGCGFRLITLQRGANVFVPFIGTHDECQRWLENNSRLKKASAGKGTLLPILKSNPLSACPAETVSTCLEEDVENELAFKISDNDLRRVFAGLVKGAKKR